MSTCNIDKDINTVVERSKGLKREMKSRHIYMLAVGGTIGTGLFLGSGYVLKQAGPGGIIVAYIIGGIVMYLMMMCLAELVLAMPVSGNTQAYATQLISPSAGFTIGWVGFVASAVTIPTQIVAASIIMKNIFPTVSSFIWVIAFSLLMLILNIFKNKDYGETEFWFCSLKIITIVLFIIIGFGMIFGLVGAKTIGLTNFAGKGGMFPNGWTPILMCMMTATYAYVGSDNFAYAAGESKNPEKDLPKAINGTIWTLVIFYCLSVIVLAFVLPWQSADLLGSPFAYIFKNMGLKSAELIINIVVLTSSLSSCNTFVYTSMRILWSMSKFKQAPKILSKVNKNKVPIAALIVTMIFASMALATSVFAAGTVYLFLTSVVSSSNIYAYALDCVCEYIFRKKYVAAGNKVKDLRYHTPLFPFTPIAGTVLYVLMIIGMGFDKTQRSALYLGIPMYALIYVCFSIYKRKKAKAVELSLSED